MKNIFKAYCFILFFIAYASEAMAVAEPTVPASGLVITPGCGQFTIDWINGNGQSRLVIVSSTAISSANLPVDLTNYSASNVYGSGSTIGGAYVVYSSPSNNTTVTVTGLTDGQQYYVAVFEFNGSGVNSNYLTSAYPVATATAIGVTGSVSVTKTTFCSGDTSILSANYQNAVGYSWTSSNDTSFRFNTNQSVPVFPTAPGQTSTSTYNYSVTVYISNGCSTTVSTSVTVKPTTQASICSFPGYCTNAGNFTLTCGSPAGGTYSGTNVTNGRFYPAGSGNVTRACTVTYTFTNSFSCVSTASTVINVKDTSSISFPSLSPRCANGVSFSLTSVNPAASPRGGIFSGAGVYADTMFNPANAGGSGTKALLYTVTKTNGCVSSASSSINLVAPPAVSYSTAFASVCPDFSPFPLTQGSPSGGVYSGPSVNGQSVVRNGYFYPVNGDTVTVRYPITYTITTTTSVSGVPVTCSNSVSQNLSVYPIPPVSFSAPEFCSNQGRVLMSGGSPGNGVYVSPFISNNFFNTDSSGSGVFAVTYRYTNSNGCTNQTIGYVTVNASPVVQLASLNPVCLYDRDTLSANGTPAGGTFSGNGITDPINGIFNSSIADTGFTMIHYVYTDVLNGCSSEDSAQIYVNPLPEVTVPTFAPRCMNKGPLPLTGAIPAGGAYYGSRVVNNTFYAQINYPTGQLPSTLVTDTIRYQYTDSSTGCTNRNYGTIVVWPFPNVNLGTDTTIFLDESVLVDAGNPGSTYQWSTGATTQTVLIDTTGRGCGTFAVAAKVTNSYGCFNRDTMRVTILCTVGINPLTVHTPTYNFYPNPFTDKAQIDVPESMRLMVFDSQGRKVLDLQLVRGVNSFGEQLPAGAYEAELLHGKDHATFRFIRQ